MLLISKLFLGYKEIKKWKKSLLLDKSNPCIYCQEILLDIRKCVLMASIYLPTSE